MLIIAGHITVDAAARDDYVQSCVVVVEAARATPGCLAFSITADTADPRRICIHERWQDEEPLLAFRSSGPSPEQQAAIIDADVKRYRISAIGEA